MDAQLISLEKGIAVLAASWLAPNVNVRVDIIGIKQGVNVSPVPILIMTIATNVRLIIIARILFFRPAIDVLKDTI